MRSSPLKRSTDWQLETSMPLEPLAGLLLRDGAGLHELAVPDLPPLSEPRLASPSSVDIGTSPSRQAAAAAWAKWWPTALASAGDPETLVELGASSAFWRSYLAEQRTAALTLSGQLKTDWSQAERPRLRQPGQDPEQRAARAVLTGCEHGRSHRHHASIIVFPFADACWQPLGNAIVVDVDSRTTEWYVERLAEHLEALWDEPRQ